MPKVSRYAAQDGGRQERRAPALARARPLLVDREVSAPGTRVTSAGRSQLTRASPQREEPRCPASAFSLDSVPAIRNRVVRRPLLPYPFSCSPSPFVKIPRKTIRYECVGGPRDGDVVLIQRTKHHVELDGALYEVRLWAKMDEHGQRLLWKREALIWEGLLTSDAKDQPTTEAPPPQPVDWPLRDG